nr:MAG TPA: hypothetical protein [Caudoviricetes sp.]
MLTNYKKEGNHSFFFFRRNYTSYNEKKIIYWRTQQWTKDYSD